MVTDDVESSLSPVPVLEGSVLAIPVAPVANDVRHWDF